MLRLVALVRTEVSEDLSASIIRVTRISELGALSRLLVTANVVPSSPILVSLRKDLLSSSETSVLTRATQRKISEDAILHSHRRENFKSYIVQHILPLQIFPLVEVSYYQDLMLLNAIQIYSPEMKINLVYKLVLWSSGLVV
jgi:hypothetical protein